MQFRTFSKPSSCSLQIENSKKKAKRRTMEPGRVKRRPRGMCMCGYVYVGQRKKANIAASLASPVDCFFFYTTLPNNCPPTVREVRDLNQTQTPQAAAIERPTRPTIIAAPITVLTAALANNTDWREAKRRKKNTLATKRWWWRSSNRSKNPTQPFVLARKPLSLCASFLLLFVACISTFVQQLRMAWHGIVVILSNLIRALFAVAPLFDLCLCRRKWRKGNDGDSGSGRHMHARRVEIEGTPTTLHIP